MPWKEICPMEQRMEFVIQYRSGTLNMAALCRLFGISRQTGHKWVIDAASRFLLACTALRTSSFGT